MDADTPEMVEAALVAFNGGIVREANEQNPRGYVDFYRPFEAMRAAIAAAEPFILERAAREAEGHYADHPATTVRAANYRHAGRRIAQAIRALKDGGR